MHPGAISPVAFASRNMAMILLKHLSVARLPHSVPAGLASNGHTCPHGGGLSEPLPSFFFASGTTAGANTCRGTYVRASDRCGDDGALRMTWPALSLVFG